MLSRFIAKPSHLRLLTLLTSQSQSHLSNHNHHSPLPTFPPIPIPNPNLFNSFPTISRHFSSNRDNNNNNDNGSNQPGFWNISSENDLNVESVFGEDAARSLEGTAPDVPSKQVEDPWVIESKGKGGGRGDDDDDIFKGVEDRKAIGTNRSGGFDEWNTAEGYKDWNFVVEEGKEGDVFDIGEGVQLPESWGVGGDERSGSLKSEEEKKLEIEEEELRAIIKGPNRAFGDLVNASGITDAMLDSLILLKDLEGIEGLPPLSELEELRYENNTKKSSRAEIERLKQEEETKARVRQVDSQGRAYGTGKRKCSIARVWIQPGEGKFIVNDKQFDVYFPMLDHRAALLRPFSETKTLGQMDVSCTVKGGGVSGQVGAIRLGISRALQNWAPDQLRPPLKAAGFLTRDSRVVERKKPGKAKARKSFQWVKR